MLATPMGGTIAAYIVKCMFSLGSFVCVNTVVCKGRQSLAVSHQQPN